MGKGGFVFWSVLAALVIAIPFLLFGLYYWASKDPGVGREIAYKQFRKIHELRGLRRSGYSDSAPIHDGGRLDNDR